MSWISFLSQVHITFQRHWIVLQRAHEFRLQAYLVTEGQTLHHRSPPCQAS